MDVVPTNRHEGAQEATQTIRDEYLHLMLFLATAARGNLDEAQGYGSLRLLQGVQRMARSQRAFGISDAELEEALDVVPREAARLQQDREFARTEIDHVIEVLLRRLASEIAADRAAASKAGERGDEECQ